MKKYILLGLFALLATVIYISSFYFANKQIIVNQAEKKPIQEKTINNISIAILKPVSHPSLDKIEQGFKDTIAKLLNFNINYKSFNANGNMNLLRSQIEEIINSNFDLILAIATPCAQMAKEITIKRNKLIPIVFVAVTDPLTAGIIDSLDSSKNHTTGVMDYVPHEQQLDLLLYLKPEIKTIMLVYNAGQQGLEKSKSILQQLLDKRKIKLLPIEVFQVNEIQQKASPFISQSDALIILKDNVVVTGIDILVKLCNQHNVTLFTSDLDSVEKGAALGFGVYEYDMGVEAAYKVQQIIEFKKKPSEIPITQADNFKLKINKDIMVNQGLRINDNLFFLLSKTEIYNKKG